MLPKGDMGKATVSIDDLVLPQSYEMAALVNRTGTQMHDRHSRGQLEDQTAARTGGGGALTGRIREGRAPYRWNPGDPLRGLDS